MSNAPKVKNRECKRPRLLECGKAGKEEPWHEDTLPQTENTMKRDLASDPYSCGSLMAAPPCAFSVTLMPIPTVIPYRLFIFVDGGSHG